MLFEVILPLERLAADLAGEGDVILVAALVNHQVVGFGEAALAILADELALGPHLAAELPPVVTLHLHNREHGEGSSLCRLEETVWGDVRRAQECWWGEAGTGTLIVQGLIGRGWLCRVRSNLQCKVWVRGVVVCPD